MTSEGDVISSEERFSEPMNGPELLASSEQFSEPMNGADTLALVPGEYLIYEETIVVMTPSVDSETPQG